MNQPQQYMDSHAQQAAPAPAMPQYSSYGQPQPLQPATYSYQPQPQSYPQHSYTMPPMSAPHPVTTSMGPQMIPQASLPLPTMASNAQPPPGGNQQYPQQAFDTSGQIAPPGMKPRVTATLWEDEGSLCFQVEANGVCVARREDNHMINGTKLLNVAGMTRGRRDGILKSEKTRHVVKIGPMHLKGVWIPFDRALDFANKEKITELLYPLFVHNIGALLYHPTNQARQSIGNAAMAAAARRPDSSQDYMRTPQGTQPPALTHHHSMSTPISAGGAQPPHSIAPHPGAGRPGLDRAHTFPTPPTTASGLPMSTGYEYGAQGGAVHSGQPLPYGTTVSRTEPSTPAATSPGNSQGIQYQTSQPAYSSQYYSAPSQYAQQYAGMPRYNPVQQSPGGPVKSEMGPPARAGAENEHAESKPQHNGYGAQQDADGEHEGEYTHSASYGARRPSYNYNPNTAPGPAHPESSHVSPEQTHSPHQNGVHGSSTPRTTGGYSGYNNTTPRPVQLPSSNLNYVMSNDTRPGAPNGPDAGGYQSHYQQSPQQYPTMNGAINSHNKRGRDDDDEPHYANGDASMKRQRTDPSVGMAQPQSAKVGGRR
ncbi:Putative transcription regulator HTH, APSES-type DNA-binding domain, EFG1/Phd1/StuA family [Septoria linicola]|uniref:Transcription regulator HTH, APSES-type DNA-binding domain, EFG1/Phd1/StuA family n=1 Tax=Septoria linicola TaxID=215465 RepID=A0A9Q9EN28_9PEZI|nr:putative transcription regulator HTH, APSES-type DNA-binding domain, EFG1/Phd1/StuA family [Septoria linicola]USW56655.1 Putative transcription regulator HTH, APSES-type DNA-binding domain, EFG1/Phd1/StuA family [Septoria linicola]